MAGGIEKLPILAEPNALLHAADFQCDTRFRLRGF
jgi:hypothetical protein